MAETSLRPMRRNKISVFPASVSKNQALPFMARGIGAGQFSAPMYSMTDPSGSFTKRCISRYLRAKLVWFSASWIGSPEKTMSRASGPRISSIGFSSLFCAAATKAWLASSGDENVFWPFSWAAEPAERHANSSIASAAIFKRSAQSNFQKFGFVRRICNSSALNVRNEEQHDSSRGRSVASAAAVKAAAKASASARRKATFLSATAVATEGVGMNAALTARLGIATSGAAVAGERLRSSARVKSAAGASAPIERVAVIKRLAGRVIPRVIENGVVVMPIETPVVPAPPVAPKEPNAEANSEEQRRSVIPNTRIGIPTRPGDHRASVYDPGIVRGNVDNFRVNCFDLDVGVCGRYGLLRRGIQISSFLRAAPHNLNSVHHGLFLIVIGVAERRRPRDVFVHVTENRRKRSECFDAGVPRLLVHGLG